MGATSEFLAIVPRRGDGKRHWPPELRAQIVAETLIEGETINAVVKRHELIPSIKQFGLNLNRRGFPWSIRFDSSCLGGWTMSAPLPSALRTRFQIYIEEGLSGRR